MIGEVKTVLELLSRIEEELGADVKRVLIVDNSGLIRVEFKMVIPEGVSMEYVKRVKELLSETLDTYGTVLSGNVLDVSGYILSGREP